LTIGRSDKPNWQGWKRRRRGPEQRKPQEVSTKDACSNYRTDSVVIYVENVAPGLASAWSTLNMKATQSALIPIGTNPQTCGSAESARSGPVLSTFTWAFAKRTRKS
jgi:hypothetical protein